MKPRTLKIDPEFASLIPPLSSDEREQLEASLLADGCIDALAVWRDTLIDGHNRYDICHEHGIEFGVTNIANLETRDDAITWIVQHQLGRRNLSDFTRVELALRIKPILEAKAKERERKGASAIAGSQKSDEGRTDQKIAAVARVSRDTVRKVEAIKKNGSDVLVAAAKAEEISINKAAKIADLPKKKQPKALKEAKAPKPKKEKAAFDPAKCPSRDTCGVVAELAEVREKLDDAVDMLKTEDAILGSQPAIEMQKLRETLKQVTRRRDELMAQAVEMRREIGYWKGVAKKAGWKPGKTAETRA